MVCGFQIFFNSCSMSRRKREEEEKENFFIWPDTLEYWTGEFCDTRRRRKMEETFRAEFQK